MASPPAPDAGAGAGAAPPALTVAAVARRLGVAPATLRTWDRRYGVGPSGHSAGAHRRYDSTDLARLNVMRRLILQGVAPAEAARAALSAAIPAGPPEAFETFETASGRGAGGRVLALPPSSPAARGLARAMSALDAAACYGILQESIERRGVALTWTDLVVPVLQGIGAHWAATGQGVDGEHLFSECVLGSLRSVARAGEIAGPALVLLGGAEEEQHVLPVHALAAALAERGVGCRILGPRVPQDALASAVRRSGPAAVFLWSHCQETGSTAQLADLPALRPAPRLLVGGPGWHLPELPAGVRHVERLEDAIAEVLESVGI